MSLEVGEVRIRNTDSMDLGHTVKAMEVKAYRAERLESWPWWRFPSEGNREKVSIKEESGRCGAQG